MREARRRAMKRQTVAATVIVLALALVIAPTAWAQGPSDEEILESIVSGPTVQQAEYCDPTAGMCTYVTYEDNEDNAGTGVADNDMGWDGVSNYYVTCSSGAKHPIEFNVAVSAVTYNVDAVLLLIMPAANDPARIGSVYFNGRKLTDYYHATTSSGLYDVWVSRLDPSLVHAGDNLVGVHLRSGTCMRLMQAMMWMYDHEVWEAGFVPEPGTMVLLGSGLAGMAGYATLRWRRRE
jgi:hypothetical protein